jgi:hypothetical protein
MKLGQLVGRHLRLQRELAGAYSNLPWQTDWIDRLTRDIAAVEHEIVALRAPAEGLSRRGGNQDESTRSRAEDRVA